MKKIIFSIFIFFSFILSAHGLEKINVTFHECVDGDTAKFKMNEEIIKVRFLAINTPESVHPTVGVEAYGKNASNFTCNKLESANKIELEFDPNSDKKDKYDRYLAWIWVDNVLIQDLIISEGLGEVAYLYGDYKYTELLKDHQSVAESKKIGIWSDNETDTSNTFFNLTPFECIVFAACILVITILCIYSTSFRKKTIRKLKSNIKKQLKSELHPLE